MIRSKPSSFDKREKNRVQKVEKRKEGERERYETERGPGSTTWRLSLFIWLEFLHKKFHEINRGVFATERERWSFRIARFACVVIYVDLREEDKRNKKKYR